LDCRPRDKIYPRTISQIASGGARDIYAVRNACNAKTVCGSTATIVTMERAAETGNGDARIAVPSPPWQMRQCSWSIGGAVWPGCLPLEPPPISKGQRTPAAITMPESPATICSMSGNAVATLISNANMTTQAATRRSNDLVRLRYNRCRSCMTAMIGPGSIGRQRDGLTHRSQRQCNRDLAAGDRRGHIRLAQ
jgi:hypothetical protein